MDLGRMFGFAYGHKENGAVFCHMATMFGNALYTRGFAKEAYKVFNTLFEHCNDVEKSRILIRVCRSMWMLRVVVYTTI